AQGALLAGPEQSETLGAIGYVAVEEFLELLDIHLSVGDCLGNQFGKLRRQLGPEVRSRRWSFMDIVGHCLILQRILNRCSVSRVPWRACSISSRYLSASARSFLRASRKSSSASSARCSHLRASFLRRSCSIGSSAWRASLRASFSLARYSRILPSCSALRSCWLR